MSATHVLLSSRPLVQQDGSGLCHRKPVLQGRVFPQAQPLSPLSATEVRPAAHAKKIQGDSAPPISIHTLLILCPKHPSNLLLSIPRTINLVLATSVSPGSPRFHPRQPPPRSNSLSRAARRTLETHRSNHILPFKLWLQDTHTLAPCPLSSCSVWDVLDSSKARGLCT